jgi:ClpP class serine protease
MNNIDLQLLGMVQNTSWAMHLPKLDEISLFFEKRINGVNIDFAKTADMQDGITADKTYQVQDSIAIIPIFGSLLKRANLMTSISGGTSMQILEREIAKALSDDDVEGILLNVDSPGGTVDGTKQLADFIYNNRGTKPIVAFTDGMMCSAAYWIASAADCRIAYDTSLVGSIGVATVHYDRSGADEKDGVKRTIITAGKFKQITNDANPLSDEARIFMPCFCLMFPVISEWIKQWFLRIWLKVEFFLARKLWMQVLWMPLVILIQQLKWLKH